MATVQDYQYSGPFSACRGECGRAVIAAIHELCEFCQGLKTELEAKPELPPEPGPQPVDEACVTCGVSDNHLHVTESEPETQPAYR